jgi:hypothetical protein
MVKELKAKNKAYKVIESCETTFQCTQAALYILRYKQLFGDEVGYGELLGFLTDKRKFIFNSLNT